MTDHTLSQTLPRKRVLTGAAVRRFLGFAHLWVGLICGLPFVALGITGSVLMLGHNLPIMTMTHGNTANVGAIVDAAASAAPEGARVTGVDLPAMHGDPAVVRFALPRNGEPAAFAPGPTGNLRVLVDPMTLSTSPDTAQRAGGFMRIAHDLHGRMLIAGPTGRSIVGWLGVLMTCLGLSGIVPWWPKPSQWRSAFTFRFGRLGLKFNRDLHGAVGIWGLIVFLIVSFSGVYIAFPQTLNDAFGAGRAVRDARGNQPVAKVTPIDGETELDIDGVVALARTEVSDGLLRSVLAPLAPDQPYRVALVRNGDGSNAPRVTVFVDPWAKRVTEVRDPKSYSAADTFLTWQRPLHTGLGLGWIWWSLVFLSGFLPLMFFITGFCMWLIKRRNKRRVMAV